MKYDLSIRKHNEQAHIDIAEEVKRKRDGQLTFILRVNNGNIVDCVIMEYINASKYIVLKSVTVTELTIAHYRREGSE